MGAFNTPLSEIDMSIRQKFIKEISELNHTTEQMDLTNIYRMFHPTAAEYTFFSAAYKTFSKTAHTLEHKACLSKYKRIEIIFCILSGHNGVKQNINRKDKHKKCTHRRLYNTLLNDQWIIQEIRENI